jgi:hypothetical protein
MTLILCSLLLHLGVLLLRQPTLAPDKIVGKPGELAFGYGGSVGAWRNFDDSDRFSDEEVNDFKKAWRRQHPRIATPPWEIEPGEEDQLGFWYQLEDAAIATVMTGEEHTVGPLRYVMRGQWLVCVLPSAAGRSVTTTRAARK